MSEQRGGAGEGLSASSLEAMEAWARWDSLSGSPPPPSVEQWAALRNGDLGPSEMLLCLLTEIDRLTERERLLTAALNALLGWAESAAIQLIPAGMTKRAGEDAIERAREALARGSEA